MRSRFHLDMIARHCHFGGAAWEGSCYVLSAVGGACNSQGSMETSKEATTWREWG